MSCFILSVERAISFHLGLVNEFRMGQLGPLLRLKDGTG